MKSMTPAEQVAIDRVTLDEVSPQKRRTGLSRVWHALGYSLQGLHAAWYEKAFRQEALLAAVLLPSAVWLGQSWLEVLALIATVEATVDRVGVEWHALSKKAKDLGSAAVLLSLLLCAGAWMAALVHRLT